MNYRRLLPPLLLGITSLLAGWGSRRLVEPVAPIGELAHEFHTEAVQQGRRVLSSRSARKRLLLPKETDSFSFAVFGDRTGGPASGIRVLEQAVSDVNVIGPDLILTVGDLIQGYNDVGAWKAQAKEFSDVMNRLHAPWFPVAGNHDIYWRGEGPKPEGEHERNYETHFGPLWYAFEHKNSWFVVLYSDEGHPESGEKSFNKPACQVMSDEQFTWLEATLRRARHAKNVFVFLHHPRWLKGGYGEDWDRVHALLATHGQVRAVFAGHIHRMRYDGKRDGIEYFALATTGGGLSANIPQAGLLHHYHLATVRGHELSIATMAVGDVIDPRWVTGQLAEDCAGLHSRFYPEMTGLSVLNEDYSMRTDLSITLNNPSQRPIEVTLDLAEPAHDWSLEPDMRRVLMPPDSTRSVGFELACAPGVLVPRFPFPELRYQVDYLGEHHRVPLPERSLRFDLQPPPDMQPLEVFEEGVLQLKGGASSAKLSSERLGLHDGPFTLEAWFRAEQFRRRQGFLCKTENSEFGIFLSNGVPEFLVHLDRRYVRAAPETATLSKQKWHHIAGVFDGEELRLYQDGALIARQAGSGKRSRNSLPFLIGADVNRNGDPVDGFKGLIDEVRLSGIARYAGDAFTPLRRSTPDSDTILLCDMNADMGPWLPNHGIDAFHPLLQHNATVVPVPESREK